VSLEIMSGIHVPYLGNHFFCVAAKQATSPADLVGKLVEFGISSVDTHAFAEEIFSRVPRKSSGLNVSFSFFFF